MSADRTNSIRSVAETKVGTEWLQQFDPEDIETARLLLDSLMFVSNQELSLGIKNSIDKFLGTHEGKMAVYVAREVPKAVRDYWKDQETNRMNRIRRELDKALGIETLAEDISAKVVKDDIPMYFENKRCRPEIIDASSPDGIGSEGTIAHLCRYVPPITGCSITRVFLGVSDLCVAGFSV